MTQNDSTPTSDNPIHKARGDSTSKNRFTEKGLRVSRRHLLVAGTGAAAAVITTVISPAGAGTDSRLTSAWRNASSTSACQQSGCR